jgi:hypothetical protein
VIAALLLAVAVLGSTAAPGAQNQASVADAGPVRLAGRPLADALLLIGSRGVKVIFSTDLVRPEMRVEREPRASRPRQMLDEVLAPHRLTVRAGPRGTLLVVAAARPRRPPAAGERPASAPPSGSEIPTESSPPRFKETVDVSSRSSEDAVYSPTAVLPAQVGATAGGLENVFHTLQLLPGVTAVSDFGSRLSVRGGGPDQNLIVMDGFEVHNPYRLFGLVSGINPETVDRFELFAGAFSARYGDRLSSLLAIDTRDGSAARRIQGSANVSLTDANVVLEGGLPGGRHGSWMITGRRTYYDLVAERLTSAVTKFPSFTDTQFKTVWEPSPGQRVTVHGLFSRESTDFSATGTRAPDDELNGSAIARTRTALVAAAWDSALGARSHLRSSVSFSNLEDALSIDAEGCLDTRRTNTRVSSLPCFTPLAIGHKVHVHDLTLREELTIPVKARQTLETGVEVHGLQSRLSLASAGEDFPALTIPGLGMLGVGQLPYHAQSGSFDATVNGGRVGAWVEDRVQATASLFVVPGLRLDHVGSTGETLLAPRLASSLAVGRSTRLRGAAGLHFQSPGYEKSFLGGSAFALDLSAPAASGLRSERALQGVLGIERDVVPGLTARVEVYRRRLDRLIVGRLETEAEQQARLAQYDFPADLQGEIPLAPLITKFPANEGTGQASGLEVFVQKTSVSPETRLTGWLSYSFGRARREAYGLRYPYDYDRRHGLSVVGQVKALTWLTLSGSAQAASGLPATLPIGARVARSEDVLDSDRDGIQSEWVPFRDFRGLPIYELDYGRMGNINSTRLSATARVDLRATFRPHGTAGRWVFYLDVINVFNHRNGLAAVSLLNFNPLGDRPTIENQFGGGLPILPTFGVRWRF